MASFAAPNVQTASQNHTQNSANSDLGSQHANGQANNSIKKIDEENCENGYKEGKTAVKQTKLNRSIRRLGKQREANIIEMEEKRELSTKIGYATSAIPGLAT